MISRALGPALGGSIGLMFTVANTISVATYTIGFSESLLDFLQVNVSFLYCYLSKIVLKKRRSICKLNVLSTFLGCHPGMEWYRYNFGRVCCCWMQAKRC